MMKQVLLCLCIIAISLAAGDCGVFNSADYQNNKMLRADYQIFWTVSEVDQTIKLAMKANTTGWVGFGIAEPTSGSMPGSDMVIGYVDDVTGMAYANDYHTVKFETPIVDDCQSWTLVNGVQENGWTIIEVTRNLTTGDAQDRDIVPGLRKVVFAFAGDNEDVLSYHRGNRQATAVHFFGQENVQIDAVKANPNYKYFDVLANDYQILTNETIYQNFISLVNNATVNPDFGSEFHIIAIEPLIQESSSKYIHHFAVLGKDNNNIENQLWGWAPGVSPFILPAAAGFRAGGVAGNSIYQIRLNIHYDNVNGDVVTELDNSGIRVYYATGANMRTYDAAVFRLGDPYVRNSWSPITQGTGRLTYEYDCPSKCTEQMITQPITAFGSFLHMHDRGRMMWANLWRNGTKVAELNRIEFFQFDFQQQTDINFQILPGDRLSCICQYERDPSKTVEFGQDSAQEMCVHSLAYYPRIGTQNLCGVLMNNLTMCDTTKNVMKGQPSELDNDGGEVQRFANNEVGFVCSANVITTVECPKPTDATSTTSGTIASTTDAAEETETLDSSSTLLMSMLLFVFFLF